MRRLLTIALMLLCSHAPAATETLWASGVTEKTGWRDYNKNFNGKDDRQCWAITAANLIDWWQSHHTTKLPANTPQGEDILRVFTRSFANDGSDPDEAISWWFSGEYKPGRADCAALQPNCPGGYLKPLLPSPKGMGTLLSALRGEKVNARTASAALIDGAQRGAAFWIGVTGSMHDGRSTMHSLNVWGVCCETDADGTRRLSGIWIADSDDRTTGLCYVPLKVEKDALLFHCPEHPIYGLIPRIVVDTISTLRLTP